MSIDYDEPRPSVSGDVSQGSVADLAAPLDLLTGEVDEAEGADTFELPGADLSGEELWVRVVPQQADEFVCSRCFLVHHRSRRIGAANNPPVCRDCAS